MAVILIKVMAVVLLLLSSVYAMAMGDHLDEPGSQNFRANAFIWLILFVCGVGMLLLV